MNKKRILSVTIKRMIDDSPDTSWLGEYSNKAETDYAIDRRHDLDCPVNDRPTETIDKLERILSFVQVERNLAGDDPNSTEWESLDEAMDAIIALQDELAECSCNPRSLSRDYHYFNGPVDNYKGESPEDIRKYVRQDYERMESLNAGHWCFIGIRAEAEITPNVIHADNTPYARSHGVIQKITSGGLWGVESDSDKAYLADIEKEELSSLREELRSLGFSSRAISTAFKNMERTEE